MLEKTRTFFAKQAEQLQKLRDGLRKKEMFNEAAVFDLMSDACLEVNDYVRNIIEGIRKKYAGSGKNGRRVVGHEGFREVLERNGEKVGSLNSTRTYFELREKVNINNEENHSDKGGQYDDYKSYHCMGKVGGV